MKQEEREKGAGRKDERGEVGGALVRKEEERDEGKQGVSKKED